MKKDLNKNLINVSKKHTAAVILARGGSKGIKNKNILKINGYPLIYWSIKTCLNSKKINSVWVSSDSERILTLSKKFGAKIIKRPKIISGDKSSSEKAWLHAMKLIQNKFNLVTMIGVQPTSPLRPKNSMNKALKFFYKKKLDSLFTAEKISDHFIWKKKKKSLKANYNYRSRPMRQKIKDNFLENGSFYIFNSKKFLKEKCRLFGKIGIFEMKKIYSFQIDEKEDINLIKNLKRYF